MTSDIPNGAMPKKEGEGGGGGGEGDGGEGEKSTGSGDEDKERQGSYDMTDGEPNKMKSEVVSALVHVQYT